MQGRAFALFDTVIGRCGVAWGDAGLIGMQLPEASPGAANPGVEWARLRKRFPDAVETPPPSEISTLWRERASRPLAPAHLRVTASGADQRISWIRRDRLGGDVWDGEIPLSERREAYRLRVRNGAAVVREVELEAPVFVHTAAMRAADLAAGAGVLSVEVAQGSAGLGWGATAILTL